MATAGRPRGRPWETSKRIMEPARLVTPEELQCEVDGVVCRLVAFGREEEARARAHAMDFESREIAAQMAHIPGAPFLENAPAHDSLGGTSPPSVSHDLTCLSPLRANQIDRGG
eukprot:SAG31_NODE_1596_length_7800_cov_4.335801_3_plen_114_part_00